MTFAGPLWARPRDLLSPAVRHLATEQDIELRNLIGSGSFGRISKADVEREIGRVDGNRLVELAHADADVESESILWAERTGPNFAGDSVRYAGTCTAWIDCTELMSSQIVNATDATLTANLLKHLISSLTSSPGEAKEGIRTHPTFRRLLVTTLTGDTTTHVLIERGSDLNVSGIARLLAQSVATIGNSVPFDVQVYVVDAIGTEWAPPPSPSAFLTVTIGGPQIRPRVETTPAGSVILDSRILLPISFTSTSSGAEEDLLRLAVQLRRRIEGTAARCW